MASDLLGISVTGLRVSQSALSTTGHNISNAGVEGYSRQKVNAATNPATLDSGAYVGNGANVQSIERMVNDFVTKQLRVDTTLYNDLNTYHQNVAQLDNLLSDPDTGLSSAMESFFAAVQNGTDDPTSIPARNLVISESENLADRFNTIYARLESIDNGVDEALSTSVSQINALVSNIADINRKVADAVGASNGATPNDLLDQRDEALRKLAEQVSIQTYEEANGVVNVSFARGQSLVVGSEARTLTLAPAERDSEKLDVFISDGQHRQALSSLISGGELGGLLRFRDGILGDAYNELGRVAVVMADTFNQVHQSGITLDNQFGRDFFYDINNREVATSRVTGHADNRQSSNRALYLNIADSSQVQPSNYSLRFESSGLYRIERESDGAEVATGILPGTLPATLEFDGLELVLESGSFYPGDEFKLQPVKSGARDFTSQILDPRAIAFGAPLSTDASLGNTGTGEISAGEVLSLTGQSGETLPLLANAGEMDPPLLIRFTSDTTYEVLDNSDPGNPTQLDPPIRNQKFVPGVPNSVFPSDPGETLVTADGPLLGLPSGKAPVVNDPSAVTNGYPAEAVTFTRAPATPGGDAVTQTVYTPLNGSARQVAAQLSNVEGVSVNAFTYAELSNYQMSNSSPLQVTFNGEDLIEYRVNPNTGVNEVSPAVPDPVTDPRAFNDYLAGRINDNDAFQNQGIYAVSGQDPATGAPELRIHSTRGDDLQIDYTAAAGETMDIGDGQNDNVTLSGNGAGNTESTAVGGRFDVAMADGITMRTFPPDSMLFGDSTAEDFARNRYLGIQVNLNGAPDQGDDFSIAFNVDGASDNRNGLTMVNLQKQSVVDQGAASLAESYGSLVEKVGIDTSAAKVNSDASEKVLEQTTQMRNSVSAVNLDEEAANLIRYEQMYSANAQVISVARNLFDTLINSF